MKVIELNKGQVAIVDDEDFLELAQYCWVVDSKGYARRKTLGKRNGKVIKMHREIMKPESSKIYVDHINGNKLDNRRSNLRFASHAENAANSKPKITNIL